MQNEIMQLKIELKYITPPIWRRFLVSPSMTLSDLHYIIQIVMGWSNSHLHSFRIAGEDYSSPDPSDGFYDNDMIDSSRIKLSKLPLLRKSKFSYTYDFGDNWEHIITVEDIAPAPENLIVPFCLEGQRACPPEDCGSVPGYEGIIEALKNPKKKESKDLLEWIGEYNPEEFDIESINSIFQPRKTKRKKSK